MVTEADTLGSGWLPRLLNHADTQLNAVAVLRAEWQADFFFLFSLNITSGLVSVILLSYDGHNALCLITWSNR